MSLPSARPRRASPGSRTQGRKKSSTGELPCHRVNKLAEVRPLKNTIGTNQSNSSLVFSSARKGEQCVGNATLEKTRKVGLGTSNVDDSRPTKVNAQIKDPTAAILKTKKMKDVVEDAASQLNEKTLEDGKLSLEVVKAAQSSGQLNLSEKGLENVPHQVWYLNEHEIKSKYASEGLFKDKIDEDDSWWARVDLSKLFLSSNRLCNISSDVEKLTTLLILDLHDNALHSIPSEIGKLGQLKKLDLSHNKLRQLPEEMFELRSLVYLDLSSNQLNSIQDSMNTLESLETLILSHNMLKFLPPSIGFIHKLEILNASNNKLSCLPGEISFLRNIKTLDVSRNELETTSDSLSGLQRLEIANLRHNRLAVMPQLKSCVELKELYIGNNLLSDITLEDIKHIPNVKTLELRDNKIAIIPNELILLQALERLDLANNNLTTLPHSLGMLPNLKSLPLEGNPFKALRRDIIQRGTMGILKYLKSRLTNDEITSFQKMVCSRGTSIQAMTNSDGVSSMSMPDKYAMQKVLVMDLSNRYLEIIPKDVVCDAIEVSVQRIDLSKNRFRHVPEELNQPSLLSVLHELDFSRNILEALKPWISLAASLQYLNVGNNKLSSLPSEFELLCNLREIALPYNRFTQVPVCLYRCVKLENIIMCGNQINSIDVEGLASLKNLAVLDLQNNSINQVPPELGNLKHIRSLSLEGNVFRVPRPAILVKGTQAVLSYLRDRIPHGRDSH